MSGEIRSRPASQTLSLAIAAARRAGVTRISDVTAFAVPGIRVFQATRPGSRTLTVTQGKGLTQSGAVISALLEAVEYWSAEQIAHPGQECTLESLGGEDLAIWSGQRDEQCLALDPQRMRPWLDGTDLLSGRSRKMPWDFLALDFSGDAAEAVISTNGLAAGNTRAEALASGVAELLEHHAMARFERMSRRERMRQQIILDTIDDEIICRMLRRISAAGYATRAWSQATDDGFAAIECTIFPRSALVHDMAPAAGNGCHPDAVIAMRRALLEAVQSLATIVAGARDDLVFDYYDSGPARMRDILVGALAIGQGRLDWRDVPTKTCASTEACLDFVLAKAAELGNAPVLAFDHEPPVPGLHVAHVIAPGLLDDLRGTRPPEAPGELQRIARAIGPEGRAGPPDPRRIAFAGPSVHGLAIPEGIELRPPAICGDFAELLADPPGAVALIDGCFKTAPTVWHREILALMAAGTRVFGGASLGALRAVELEAWGMVGIGAIFEACRGGFLVRDDAVMLEHAPAQLGHAPLTVAQVDAEFALFHAGLPAADTRIMQRIVRITPYERRDWTTCLARYLDLTGRPFALSAEQLADFPSLKQQDAALTLAALAACDIGDAQERPRCPPPAVTVGFRKVLARRAPALLAGR